MTEPWYRNAVVYTIDLETFADGNADGIGDFEGLTSKLDYLAGLNVNCIWLQPFYPSPNRDHAYDICDYYSVHPRYGTLGDFVEFSQAARERGIRVIVDLVVNHTSIEHRWFQEARRDPNSRFRDYYVWAKEPPPDANTGMIFPGNEVSTWAYDDQAAMYYFHRFYSHQPDLNTQDPAVRREIEKIMTCWLQLGVSGFRVDALPFLLEAKGLNGRESARFHEEYLIDMRQSLTVHRGDAVFMAEANLPPDEVAQYFGEGDRIHVIFNFYVNQHIFLAMAREQALPIRKAYDALPKIPGYCQWANFLRSHDELDLGRLTESEREEVYRAFGADDNMRLYNRGIRRRLAPMLKNDRTRLELAHSLVLTLPGTPVLRYGDEIGMGDDLTLKERECVRTAMQWSDAANGGFSPAAPEQLKVPVIQSGEFGYERVNVATQLRDPDSLLNWLERATRLRRRSPEFGSSDWHWLETSDDAVLAHCCSAGDSSVYAVHNLSSREIEVTVDFGRKVEFLFDLMANREERVTGNGREELKIHPHGYRWFRNRVPEAF